MTDEPVDATAVEDPEDFKPSPAEMVVSDLSAPEAEVFRVLDRHDEEQILAQLQSRLLDIYVYDFPDGKGGRTMGVSFECVKDAIQLMTRTGKVRIRVIPGSLETVEIEDEQAHRHVEATLWAEDTVTGMAFSGTSTEPLYMQLSEGTAKKWRGKGRQVPEDRRVWDPFARTKAINKAERNALEKFIPAWVKETIIAQYARDPSRVKVIQGGAQAEEPEIEQVTGGRADLLRQECRQVYEEIRGVNAAEMPPGLFHRHLMRAGGSLETLATFRDGLRGKLEKMREGS